MSFLNLAAIFRRALRCLFVLVSLWLVAGPLALLQIGAWTWMLATYSQESHLGQAVRETLGGERPCEMCKAISAVSESEEEGEPASMRSRTADLLLMPVFGRALAVIAPPASLAGEAPPLPEPRSASRTVPKPPPRSAPASQAA